MQNLINILSKQFFRGYIFRVNVVWLSVKATHK